MNKSFGMVICELLTRFQTINVHPYARSSPLFPLTSQKYWKYLKIIASLVQPSQKVVVDEFQPSDWILKYVLDNTQMLHVGIIYLH